MFDWNRSVVLLIVLIMVTPESCDCRPRRCKKSYMLPNFSGSLRTHCEETLHKLDCSVGPTKNVIKDTTLQCDIKRRKGWDAYQKTLGDLSRCQYEDCEPSQLVSLQVVRIKQREYLDEVHSWPTIQLNFTIPNATADREFYPGSTLLQMASVEADEHRDSEFRSFVRLFHYPKHTSLSPDNAIQRTLRFPCFIGFQHEPCQSDKYKVYTLTLKSFSNSKTNAGITTFTALSYKITIYNYYIYTPYLWKSTIAVAFFPGEKDVTFLFDPAPVSVTYYHVSLFNVNDNTTYRHGNIGQATKHCFKDVMDGTYYITIMVISDDHQCSEGCKSTKSHIFTVGSPNGKIFGVKNYESSSPKNIIEKNVQTTKSDESHIIIEHISSDKVPREQGTHKQRYIDIRMISISVGCGVGLFLAIVLGAVCYRWKTKKQTKKSDLYSVPKALLVYSHTTPEFRNVAFEFARFCKEKLQIHVLNDDMESDVTISNESKTNCSLWYREKLSKSSAAIILWMSKDKEDHESSDEFNIGVKLAVDLKCNDFKVICVYFDKTHKRSIPNVIQKEARLFHFPATLPDFCTYVLGHKISRNITITKELRALIFNLSLNTRQMGQSLENTIPNHSMFEEETKDENGTLHHVIQHECMILKTEEIEAQPLLKHEDMKKSKDIDTSIKSIKQFSSPERKAQFKNQNSRGVHRYVPYLTSYDSVSTSELFDSGEIQNSESSNQRSSDTSSEHTRSSDLSIHCLEFKTLESTQYDNSSQLSGYVCREPTSSAPSPTQEYEGAVPSCSTPRQYHSQGAVPSCSTPRQYHSQGAVPSCSTPRQYHSQLVQVDSESISDSNGIDKDSHDDCNVDSATFPMVPLHTMSRYRTIPDDDTYSVFSDDIQDSDIDLCEFIHDEDC
ncbi:uncharacterized protein LOC125656091 [Ostrea edulis]|uniref:uncharacterized protein LOC125656091 n=1 Tax=Ostrea edulis TaxID=37623 RepID=UPI0024AF3151|nr:uncharacterized protein LOC125656091 [Ostrea edulis]